MKKFKELSINKSFKNNSRSFRIENVVKKGKTKALVKWKGYPASFNAWVDNKDLIKL